MIHSLIVEVSEAARAQGKPDADVRGAVVIVAAALLRR
jgi:hypothetical protein